MSFEIAEHRSAFLALEAEASRPYATFVYGDGALAARVSEHLLDAEAAEFAPPDGQLALDDGVPSGIVACLPGDLLRDYRAQAAEELVDGPFVASDPDLLRRVALAGRTLLRPADDELYLSRIAVSASFRRRGVADFLMAHVLAEAKAYDSARCVLEVAASAVPARRLYEKHGFEHMGEGRVEDPETGRSLHYVHMARGGPW